MQTVPIQDRYVEALHRLHYSVDEALRQFLLLNISTKLAAAEQEDAAFRTKYGMDFQDFQQRLEQRINTEIFEESDDAMAWEYAVESVRLLRGQLLQLQ
jgi:hypothetical protein